MIFDGKLFQSLIVLGQNYIYTHQMMFLYGKKLHWVRVSSFHYSYMFHIRWYIDCCLAM